MGLCLPGPDIINSMAQSFRNRSYLLIATLSFIFSCLVISFDFFPSFGISLSLVLLALFTYKYVRKGTDTKLFFTLCLVFSLLLIIRGEPVISFLNLMAAVFFGVLMLASSGKRSNGFAGYLFLPISLFLKSLLTKSEYYLALNKKKFNFKRINVGEAVFGVIVCILVLAVILPLLSSTNPIFENILRNFLIFFDLEKLIELIGFKVIFLWSVRLAFFFALLFIFPKVLTLIEKRADYTIPPTFKPRSFPLQIPKIVTSLVLIFFFITQFQLYFANEQALSALNISYSQRTREVFGQLSVVAVIVFVLIYNSGPKKLSKRINWLLGVEGVFLTLMAYKSVLEYIGAHGLTYKRLSGIVLATLVSGVFVLYKNHLKNTANDFVRQVVLFSASLLLLINIVNFDFLIYHFNKPNTGQEVDYRYLSTLSADSLSYDEQFKLLENYTFNENTAGSYNNENPLIILSHIESLQKKYSDFDLREFNLLDYIQYTRIKNVETSQLRNYYENNSPINSELPTLPR